MSNLNPISYGFNTEKAVTDCIKWIRNFFENNGPDCNAVIGISGGKDSTIVAKLCVEALGKDRVYGVLMPDGYNDNNKTDIEDARRVVDILGIRHTEINIHDIIETAKTAITHSDIESNDNLTALSEQSVINLPPRIRMSVLYAVSQTVNGRVANTCNMSEDYVGYSTRYGDSVGDFSPISCFTVTELKLIGDYLGLPGDLVHKAPSDGLCGKTDEDNLGITYNDLDTYIRTSDLKDEEIINKIEKLHKKNLFKLQLMPAFSYAITD